MDDEKDPRTIMGSANVPPPPAKPESGEGQEAAPQGVRTLPSPAEVSFDIESFPEFAEDEPGNDVEIRGFGKVVKSENGTITVSLDSAEPIHGKRSPGYAELEAEAKAGTSHRFEDAVQSMMAKHGYSRKRAEAIAASMGRRKFGAEKFAHLGALGRAAHSRG